MGENRLYIFDRLETGKSLNIIFMSHNAYWADVDMLAYYYENCKVQTFGRGTGCIEWAQLFSKWYDPIENYDLIVERETDYIEREYMHMKSLAEEISRTQNKTVTIGYSYINDDYEMVGWNREHIIKLAKYINGEEKQEDTLAVLNLHPRELVNYVLLMHDNLDYSKARKKTN